MTTAPHELIHIGRYEPPAGGETLAPFCGTPTTALEVTAPSERPPTNSLALVPRLFSPPSPPPLPAQVSVFGEDTAARAQREMAQLDAAVHELAELRRCATPLITARVTTSHIPL